MRYASSQTATCSASTSASEYTATVRTPIRRAVRATRHEISPRFAIRILSNIRAARGDVMWRAVRASGRSGDSSYQRSDEAPDLRNEPDHQRDENCNDDERRDRMCERKPQHRPDGEVLC